jgi:hypothetical protein
MCLESVYFQKVNQNVSRVNSAIYLRPRLVGPAREFSKT